MLAVAKSAELDENGHVFNDGAKRANQPGEIDKEILLLEGVEENLEIISELYG